MDEEKQRASIDTFKILSYLVPQNDREDE